MKNAIKVKNMIWADHKHVGGVLDLKFYFDLVSPCVTTCVLVWH